MMDTAEATTGPAITFGEGCDQFTYTNVFKGLADYRGEVNGEAVEIETVTPEGIGGRRLDTDYEPTGVRIAWTWEHVRTIHIY